VIELIAFRPSPEQGEKKEQREIPLCSGIGTCVGAQVALQRCPILRTGPGIVSPPPSFKYYATPAASFKETNHE
jgi:hypothetical protein